MSSFIDRSKKLIFIHVPKTGGTSIHDAVAGVDAELIPASHITTTDMRNLVGEDVYDKFMTFTVMRNPYDWLVSLFEYRYHVDIFSAAIPDHYSNFEMLYDCNFLFDSGSSGCRPNIQALVAAVDTCTAEIHRMVKASVSPRDN